MPAGFQVTGDSQVIQVDQDYSNFLLHSKGVVQLAPNAAQNISISGVTSPLLCLRPTGNHVAAVGRGLSGGVGTWTLSQASSGASATVEWYVFDSGRPAQDISPGISVYRESGALAYNSNQKALRVMSVLNLPAGSDPFVYPSGSAPVGGLYAACVVSSKLLLADGGGARVFEFLTDGIRFDSANLYYGAANVGSLPEDPGGARWLKSAASQVILVDVLGY